jgi:signal transduction histidine kinase
VTYLPTIPNSIRRSLLIIELFAFAVSIWFIYANPQLQQSPDVGWQTLLYIVAFTPFIIFFPVDRSLWLRRIYIGLGMLTIIIAERYDFFSFSLYCTFLLKGCFLLPRRDIIAIWIMYFVTTNAVYIFRAPEIVETIMKIDRRLYLNPPRIIANYATNIFSNSIFVLLLGIVWVEQQKSSHKTKRLTQQLETLATDLERNRIARDIHDTLGHSLTSLDVQIELAQRLQAKDPDRAQASIDLAKKLSTQAIENVRQALGRMQQVDFDLKEAIGALAEQERSFQVVVDLDFPQLSLQSSYQLYCIVQESLTNVQKHAQADRVTIAIKSIHNGTILEICDNGNGFDLDRVARCPELVEGSALPNRPRTGFGLRNIKERVQCLGGEFHLHSELSQGTQLKIFIPG